MKDYRKAYSMYLIDMLANDIEVIVDYEFISYNDFVKNKEKIGIA